MNNIKIFAVLSFISFAFVLNLPAQTWIKTYGDRVWERGSSIQETNDGGYIVVGRSSGNKDSNSDIYLLKIDSEGEEEWSKILDTKYYSARSVLQLEDGNYLIPVSKKLANITSIATILKLDNQGEILWEKNYFLEEYSSNAYHILKGLEERIYFTGLVTDTITRFNNLVFLMELDKEGQELWSKTYSSIGSFWLWDFVQNQEGAFFIAGRYLTKEKVLPDMLILKTDNAGNQLWRDIYGIEDEGDQARGVSYTLDGGCYICGKWDFNNGGAIDNGANLIRYDKEGGRIWERILNKDPIRDRIRSTHMSNSLDGNHIIVSALIPHGWRMTKIDDIGTVIWESNFISGASKGFTPLKIRPSKDGGYILVGDGHDNGDISNKPELYVAKTDANGTLTSIKFIDPSFPKIQLFPNPSSQKINLAIPTPLLNQSIDYSILDNQGKVLIKNQAISTNNLEIDISHFPKGVYYISFSTKLQFGFSKRFVVQ